MFMIILIGIFISVTGLVFYSLCKVSSRFSRMEEEEELWNRIVKEERI